MDAIIIIKRPNFSFAHEELKEVSDMTEGFIGNLEISKKEDGVMIEVKLPISSRKDAEVDDSKVPSSTMKVTSVKTERKSFKSFAKDRR